MPIDLLFKDLFPAIQSNSQSISNLKEVTFVGVDFGTSTTVVSIATQVNDEIHTQAVWLNQKLSDGTKYSSDKIPTVIAYYNDLLMIGQGAAEMKYQLKRGENVFYSFKMELGEGFDSKYFNSELNKNTKYPVYSPKDATTLFFKYLRVQIDRYIRENSLPPFTQYAVSIPASFEANQRKELVDALAQNDISVSKQALIDEPNAAFLSFIQNANFEGNPIKIPDDYNVNVLVFDFGAGTCDISILDVGKDINGIYSKNIAISRFEKLGGDDLDRYIAYDCLLPQMLEESGFKISDFRKRDIQKGIIPKLLNPAEKLKILICEAISLQLSNNYILPSKSDSSDYVTLETPIQVDTKKGLLTLSQPKLRYADFKEKMKTFLKTESHKGITKYEGQDPFISIFNPIHSALKKASLTYEDIDYVLLIGGSAKNPYVQHAIKSYFCESEILKPKDLQTHVSGGAAIHSLVYNGYGKNIIHPITSEPIILLTKDETPRIILPAGTQIPCELIVIDNLVVDRDMQEVIELPLFVGSLQKMLFNVKIHRSGDPFRKNTQVKLELEVNADKLVLARATADGEEVMVELNPFANKELTTEERLIYVALKEYHTDARNNLGKPTRKGIDKLADAYSKANKYHDAAEVREYQHDLYPSNHNYNQIGLEYSRAGNEEKALEYYRLGYENNKNSTTAFNYAHTLKSHDKEKAKKVFEESIKLDGDKAHSLYELGKILDKEGEPEGKDMVEQAYNIWKKKFDDGTLNSVDFTWLPSCADYLGKHHIAREVRAATPKEAIEGLYDADNLTRSKDSNLKIDF